ncbi:unnamed protein product [Ectocarpus sp. CCAP 1310/34]|nr:unnamed protein product [Ectocarpus sp. CCAP 1310/34]
MVFFWQSPSPFSQWTPSTFVFDGVVYSCAERFFAATKARLVEDHSALQNIMRVSEPALHKKFGRGVRGFDPSLWEHERENTVLTGSYAKFSQNSELRDHLLGSGDKILAEASPYDCIWGIGLQADDPEAQYTSRWRGLNLLGNALQLVRSLLRCNAPPPERSSRLLSPSDHVSTPSQHDAVDEMGTTNFAMLGNIPSNFTPNMALFRAPVTSRPYRVNPPVAKQVDAILDQYLAAGLIQHSTSPYSSPLVVIPKKSGGVRITVNYRKLNKLCALSQLPIPRVDDTLDKLLKGRIYSPFDRKSSFHQITVVNEVIKDLHGVASYLDDLIVFDNPASHVDTMRALFERLRTHNLRLTPPKATIAATEADFLGHTISPDGVRPNGAKPDGSILPIIFISRATLDSVCHWTPLNLEAGSIVWSIKRLRGYLWGTKFRIFTDRKSLEHFAKVRENNARVQRWLEFLTAYNYTLKYRKGSANCNADFLSRLPIDEAECDRSGRSQLTPDDDDEGVFFIRSCGLMPSGHRAVGVGLGGLVPTSPTSVLGGLAPITDDFIDFRRHGPRLSPSGLSFSPGIWNIAPWPSKKLRALPPPRLRKRALVWSGSLHSSVEDVMALAPESPPVVSPTATSRRTLDPAQTPRWPTLCLPLPSGPGVSVSVDYFGPLPLTPRGNTYILLFTDRFSRRADMYAVTAAEFTAEGTADVLVNQYIPLWGCPLSLLSDNGSQFCSKLSQAVYARLAIRKVATSSYHPNGNGGVERVNHTMAQMLAMVVNERQDDWDIHLPHVEFAYNNSVSAATGLAPNEVHINRLPRMPMTVFEHPYARGHRSLHRDQLEYCYLAADCQRRSYDLVREQHNLSVSRIERRNSALSDALRKVPSYTVGGWVWVYNTESTIRQGVRSGTDDKVLKAKLSFLWTGPFKILAVGAFF